MVRPERMSLDADAAHPDRWTVQATVTDLVFQGPVVRYEMRLPDASVAVAHVPARGRPADPRDKVTASWPTTPACCFPARPPPRPSIDLDADE